MSYQSIADRYEGTIAPTEDTSATPLTWDMSAEQGRAALVIDITATAEMTLHYQPARTSAELSSPEHDYTETVPANSSRQYVLPINPALPHGKLWLACVAGGDYVVDVGRRAHS